MKDFKVKIQDQDSDYFYQLLFDLPSLIMLGMKTTMRIERDKERFN